MAVKIMEEYRGEIETRNQVGAQRMGELDFVFRRPPSFTLAQKGKGLAAAAGGFPCPILRALS
jgi:hypothetical protein